MATRMGAPGVRIELHDRSGYSLVENPNAVAGVVGFAPRGELNKIQLLTNTAQQDTYFGLGFNNSRYNQGMYATRAVLNAGGHVEFVRPYGEEIDRTDDFKRDLKTDTYVVSFDRNAVNNPENTNKTSIKVDYFASTRYKTDGAARYGVSRKINNIAETIVNNSNTNFNVDASDEVFVDKKNYVSKGGSARGATDMVMFAIMNADPSAANRAYTSYKVDLAVPEGDSHRSTGELTVVSTSKVGFAVDDLVFAPAAGRVKDLCRFRVSNIVDKTITLVADDEDGTTLKNVTSNGYTPAYLFYYDEANAVADGYDYLSVKTAVAGQGAKTFNSLHMDDKGLEILKAIPSGTPLVFRDQDSNEIYVRVATSTAVKATPTAGKDSETGSLTLTTTDSVWVGDTILVDWGHKETDSETEKTTFVSEGTGSFTVTGQDETGAFSVVHDKTDGKTATDLVPLWTASLVYVKNEQSGWVDSVNTLALAVGESSTVETVVTDLVKLMQTEEIGYGRTAILGDIAHDDNGIPDIDGKTVKLLPGGALDFVPGDIVAITRASASASETAASAPETTEFDNDNILYMGTVRTSDAITDTLELVDAVDTSKLYTGESTDLRFQLINLTQTNKVAYAAVDTYVFTSDTPLTVSTSEGNTEFDATLSWDPETPDVKPVYSVSLLSFKASIDEDGIAVGDTVKFTWQEQEYTSAVQSVQRVVITDNTTGETTVTCTVTVPATNATVNIEGTVNTTDPENPVPVAPTLTTAVCGAVSGVKSHITAKDETRLYSDIYMVGNYSVIVPVSVQDKTPVVGEENDPFVSEEDGKVFKYLVGSDVTGKKFIVERSERVLTDSTIGATFVGLGLANIRYMDVNYTGTTVKVYDLTDEGEAVARLYMAISYFYNGVLYEFDGTVVKYVYNDMQLFIGDTAENELEGSGVTFVLNDSGVMEMFREDNSYDLSTTVAGELQNDGVTYKALPSSTTICSAFNPEDPAIINNAVWTYDPSKNWSTSTLSNAFNLFLDKDKSDVTFFVGAGLGLNNFGLKGYETLNTQLMQAVLNICELRKDCFALFDGVADSRINNVLKLDSPASRFGSTLGRWGAIYDARPIFYDSIVTKSNVEIAPSIPMASLITSNRRASIFWHVPAGEDTGMIPGAWCRKLKYERKFNYPEDPDSDIAKLCDIHVNPFRSNKKGIYCYGDFTMQMEDTAFNAINVTMLVAGIHKMFYNYLDSRVFRLNTTALRAQISGDLQEKLDQFVNENPAGLENGSIVICDDTNNPPEVIEAHKLNVDLMLYPTTSTRYIFLRTNVLSRTTGNVISTDITTGAR